MYIKILLHVDIYKYMHDYLAQGLTCSKHVNDKWSSMKMPLLSLVRNMAFVPALGWRWNRLDFYSSVASRELASVQPIRLLKNYVRDAIWLVKNNTFSLDAHDACGASIILWTQLYRLSLKVSKRVVSLGSKISTHVHRMYSSILGMLYTTQQLVCWVSCLLWSSLYLSSASWIDTKGSSLQQSKWIVVQWLKKNVERLWKNVTYGPRHRISTD